MYLAYGRVDNKFVVCVKFLLFGFANYWSASTSIGSRCSFLLFFFGQVGNHPLFLVWIEELHRRGNAENFFLLVNELNTSSNVSFARISESANSVKSLNCWSVSWEGFSKNQSHSCCFGSVVKSTHSKRSGSYNKRIRSLWTNMVIQSSQKFIIDVFSIFHKSKRNRSSSKELLELQSTVTQDCLFLKLFLNE